MTSAKNVAGGRGVRGGFAPFRLLTRHPKKKLHSIILHALENEETSREGSVGSAKTSISGGK